MDGNTIQGQLASGLSEQLSQGRVGIFNISYGLPDMGVEDLLVLMDLGSHHKTPRME